MLYCSISNARWFGSQWRLGGAEQGLGSEQEQEVAALVLIGGGFLPLWNGSCWLWGTYVASEQGTHPIKGK